MQRAPAVANAFYTGNKEKLRKEIEGFLANAKISDSTLKNAISYVAPHAGYKYSGQIAAFTYKALSIKNNLDKIDTFVMIGPNHTGLGYPLSVSLADWNTTLGLVENDLDLSKEIISQSQMITADEQAHRLEHSIEVQFPFLQEIVKKPRCCFICMGDQSLGYCRELTSAISRAAKKLGRRVVVIASSDFNHYESAETAQAKDMPAIEALKSLVFERFHEMIEESGDSACGYGPITVAAMFARDNGARRGALLKYSNSGDVTKDYGSVVAYASIAFV